MQLCSLNSWSSSKSEDSDWLSNYNFFVYGMENFWKWLWNSPHTVSFLFHYHYCSVMNVLDDDFWCMQTLDSWAAISTNWLFLPFRLRSCSKTRVTRSCGTSILATSSPAHPTSAQACAQECTSNCLISANTASLRRSSRDWGCRSVEQVGTEPTWAAVDLNSTTPCHEQKYRAQIDANK